MSAEGNPLSPDAYYNKEYLLSFTHIYKDYKDNLRIVAGPYANSGNRIGIFILSRDGYQLGLIRGKLRVDNDSILSFQAETSYNLSGEPFTPHAPRIVGATIAELLSAGRVQRWYSSPVRDLTSQGQAMYENFLSQDERLTVLRPSLETKNRFVITAKKSE